MNDSANCSIYEFNACSVLDLYEAFIEGSPQNLIAVISAHPLTAVARDALSKSAIHLGFGPRACAWIALTGREDAPATSPLDAANLRILIEGIDPLGLIVTDTDAIEALANAYGCSILADTASRIACRNLIAFKGFEDMLNEEGSKQRAWSLLKRLTL